MAKKLERFGRMGVSVPFCTQTICAESDTARTVVCVRVCAWAIFAKAIRSLDICGAACSESIHSHVTRSSWCACVNNFSWASFTCTTHTHAEIERERARERIAAPSWVNVNFHRHCKRMIEDKIHLRVFFTCICDTHHSALTTYILHALIAICVERGV